MVRQILTIVPGILPATVLGVLGGGVLGVLGVLGGGGSLLKLEVKRINLHTLALLQFALRRLLTSLFLQILTLLDCLLLGGGPGLGVLLVLLVLLGGGFLGLEVRSVNGPLQDERILLDTLLALPFAFLIVLTIILAQVLTFGALLLLKVKVKRILLDTLLALHFAFLLVLTLILAQVLTRFLLLGGGPGPGVILVLLVLLGGGFLGLEIRSVGPLQDGGGTEVRCLLLIKENK